MSGTRLDSTPTFPEKYFYTIGDVSRMTKIQPHILRYWENHFKLLRPARRYSGHRKYTRREIDLINQIRHLVMDRKFTLDGARKEITRGGGQKPKADAPALKTPEAAKAAPLSGTDRMVLRDLQKEIQDCLAMLG